MAYLSAAGLPCPRPIADSKGRHLAIFAGKPTALVEKLAGASVISATPKQCGELGTYTARLHVAAKHFPARQPNRYDLSWCERTAADLYPALAQDDAQLLRTELAAQRALDRGLVRSTIHADLFRDNVLFDAGALSGMIDFYYACDELLLYDLAIAFNDWCVDRSGDIDTKLASSLLTAYRQTRPVTDAEIRNWPLIVRLTCLRWWIFRLARKLSRDDSAIPTGKDPDEFRDLLRAHTERTDMLIALWH
jgi:homoserine kinase type II